MEPSPAPRESPAKAAAKEERVDPGTLARFKVSRATPVCLWTGRSFGKPSNETEKSAAQKDVGSAVPELLLEVASLEIP